MSEQPPESLPRRSVEVALARMEAKLDVAIAQHSTRLDEHTRRIAANEVRVDRLEVRVGDVEVAQAAGDARDGRDDQARTSGLSRAQLLPLWLGACAAGTSAVVVILAHR